MMGPVFLRRTALLYASARQTQTSHHRHQMLERMQEGKDHGQQGGKNNDAETSTTTGAG